MFIELSKQCVTNPPYKTTLMVDHHKGIIAKIFQIR